MKSRADYFRKRRKTQKQFNAAIDKKKIEVLEKILREKGLTKVQWLNEKIDEEINF